jgi:demethylmenaquinone methyltransferase / 2-methoxy-6-polyprenyl-1,4-benzoquinol methylase
VAGIVTARQGRQQNVPPGWADNDHVSDSPRTRRLDAQVTQQLNAARTDQVATRLVTGKATPIDECDSRPRPSQAQRSRAARGSGAYDDGVEARHSAMPSQDWGSEMPSVARSSATPNDFARDLFSGLPDRYDVLAEVLSFGQNRRWRATMVDAVAAMDPPPQRVLDVATGTGGVALMLSERTRASITGVDLTEQMLRRGRDRISQRGKADRVRLLIARGEQLPFPDDSFDALTFTYLLRYVADPAATIRELTRVVRPGGFVANLEFAVPGNPWWRAAWIGYTRAVLPIAGMLTGGPEWYEVGRFLGPSISTFYQRYPEPMLQDMWRAAGIETITSRRMSLGGGLVMWGRKLNG